MTAYEDTVELTGKGNVEHTTELLGSVELTGKGAATIGLAFQALAELTGKGNLSNFAGSYTDWQYRKSITIANNSGGALSNHQVLITLTTANFDYAKCKNDGGDIRFAASDGSIALPYWIKDWNYNGTSKIWVKVDSVPVGENVCLYIYYWKPSATSESNIVNTFLFGDDFDDNDISDWVTVSGSPAVSGGMISVGANVEFEISKPSDIIEGIWEFDYQYPNGAPTSNSIQLLTQWVSAGNYYYLDRASHVTRRRFGRFVSSSESELIVSSLAFDTNWHTLKLRRDSSGNFELFEDDVSLGTITDTSHTTSNALRLKSAGANHPGLNVDNIRVRKYASSEPVATLGEEEEGVLLTSLWTLFQSAEIEGKSEPTCLLSFQPLLELATTGGISVDMISAFHELIEFTGTGKFLPLHSYIFSDIDNILIEGWSVSKTIQDVLWKFSGGIDKHTTPTYFKNFIVTADDHQDPPVNHIIFLGFIPGASYILATVADKAILNAFDYGWYLSSQFVPLSIRITDEDTNPADTIKTLLGGEDWMSTTGIEPYKINTVGHISGEGEDELTWDGTNAIKKQFIWNSKTSKWKAIKEICDYTHHVFMVKWRKTDNDEHYSVAYFVHEDEIDTYLDLPAMETINLADPYLMQNVKIEDKQEAKYNRVTVSGVDKISGTWYTKTEEAASVTSEDELPIEYVYESTDLGSQSKVDAKATELYNFFHTIARIYTASFKKRMDLELYQKIKFIGYDKIEEEMRIVGITYRRSAVEDIVTIQFTPDQKLADLRKLMRSMGADFMTEQQRIQEDFFIDLTKIAVGEVTEINGNEAIVKLEKDEGLVKARIINP